MTIFVYSMGYVLYRIHKNIIKTEDGYDEVYPGIIMVVASLVWIVFFVVYTVGIKEIFYGYVTPEYWALNRIIDIIKK